MTEDIQVTFVIPKHCKSQNDCSEDMLIAYAACHNHQGGGLQAQWVHENKLNLDPLPLKKHIFVLSEFEGVVYEQLKSTKCMLIGPRCLSCCLMEGNPIPSRGHPVFTVAMRGLVVTASGLHKDLKAKIQLKIEWMGGSYSSVLTDATTHLISNNVFSDKYIKAAERGIPIMRETWVEAVWDASLKLDVNGSSSDFVSYRLPPFANLQITTSGLTVHDKKLIMKLINSNGGEFSRVFQSQTTDVLVLPKDNVGSEKCKAAIEYGKVCVTPHWIKDSAALGFALPVSRYKICTASTSSPIAENRLPDMSLNFSRITKGGRMNNFFNETRTADVHILSGSTKIHQESREDTIDADEIQKAFESFDLGNIKKAGPIFDGFCIWVTGLEGVSRERASACVARGGGVRYDGPHERVTHVVAGAAAAAAAAAAALPAVPVLSPLWLLRSVEAGRVLDEMEFVLNAQPATPCKARRPAGAEASSPMSRRNLQLLLPGRASPPPPLPPPPPPPPSVGDRHDHDDHIVNHYLSQNLPQSEVTKSLEPVPEKKPSNDEVISQSEFTVLDNIFKDMVIEVQGLEEQAICELGCEVRAAGGVLAAAGAGGARALVPLDFDPKLLRTPTAEPVTVFWVKDCLSQQTLVPVEYYHRPVRLRRGAAPLRGVVASLSTYTGVERAFLDELAKLLGATTQQRFCRRNTASALASTHLICPEASGAKYAGAVKWGVPVVRADWLLACAAAGARVPEAAHAVARAGLSSPKASLDAVQQSKETLESTLASPETAKPKNQEEESENEKPEEKPEGKPEEKPEDKLEEKPEEKPEEKLEAHGSEAMAEDLMQAPSAARPSSMLMLHHTRKNKKQSKKAQFEGMSPATRFITMWRMGMFNTDYVDSSKENSPTVNTTKEESEDSNHEVEPERECTMQTPPLDDVLLTPNLRGLSPTTRRRLQAVKRGEMPSDPVRTPINPFAKRPSTPDSQIGGDLRPGCKRMSIEARKRLWGFVSDLPSENEQLEGAKTSQALADLCGTFLARFDKNATSPEQSVARKLDLQDLADTPPSKMAKLTENQCVGSSAAAVQAPAQAPAQGPAQAPAQAPAQGPAQAPAQGPAQAPALEAQVDVQLQRLSTVLTGRRTPRAARSRSSGAARPGHHFTEDMEDDPGPESHPNTVGWDDTTPSQRDLGITDQISKPKRVRTAPTEMIRAHLSPKVPDCKQNIPLTDPSHDNDKNNVENVPETTLKVIGEKDPEYTPAQNASEVSCARSSTDMQNIEAQEMKENVPCQILVQEHQNLKKMEEIAKLNLPSPTKLGRPVKRFMLSSNVDNREETVEMIVRLGGVVTDLKEAAPATHLLCEAPARSQRVLNSIAAGCWVLHPAYVARSAAAGVFLPEEPFEWGNPQATSLPSVAGGERALARAAHRWRTQRERGGPGPFAGAAALLHVSMARRYLLAPFICAGGGSVVDDQPPYTDESITVCFADLKRYPMKSRDREWLVARRVPVCAPILLSAFLTEETRPDLRDHCLPEFSPPE